MRNLLDLWLTQSRMSAEMVRLGLSSAETIQRRLLGRALLEPDEFWRMWMEKPPAFFAAGLDMLAAAQRGASPLVATTRGMRRIRRKTDSNARRLRR